MAPRDRHRSNRCISRPRSQIRRSPGPAFRRIAAIHHCGPAGQGGGREPREGPRGACLDRPRAPAQADHGQPVAGGPAEGRIAFRSSIALCLLAAIGAADAEALSHYVIVGELKLDGRIAPSPGVLLAALHASTENKGLICPISQGAEAAWAGNVEVVAAPDLLALLAHLKGRACCSRRSPERRRHSRAGPTSGR